MRKLNEKQNAGFLYIVEIIFAKAMQNNDKNNHLIKYTLLDTKCVLSPNY
jgi:hypothetical protein